MVHKPTIDPEKNEEQGLSVPVVSATGSDLSVFAGLVQATLRDT